MINLLFFMLCTVLVVLAVTILFYWLRSREDRKEQERNIQKYAQKALIDYGDYTSYKICGGFCLVILDDKKGTITEGPLISPRSFEDCKISMANVEKIDTLVEKGKTITENKTRWVSRTSKRSMLGNTIGAAAMLNTFGVAVLASPQKIIEKQTITNTHTFSDQYYVCVHYHVGSKTTFFNIPAIDENEMNEVCKYLCNFVDRQTDEEEEYY